ncbi:MAG: 30S ribosomal protein S1 [Bacteroidota bacterium]
MINQEEQENTSTPNEGTVNMEEAQVAQETVATENTVETTMQETPVNVTNEVPEAIAVETPAPVKVTPKGPLKPDENFDWDGNSKGGDNYKPEERTALEEKYGKTINTITDFQVVKGTVVFLNDREVVVNIGYKSDGLVALSEFRGTPNLKIGDKVDVYVESQEDKNGQLILSHKKAISLRSWERVNEALISEEIVHGYIKGKTKGGLIVDLFGLEAFLPGSQIDVRPIKDFDIFLGKTMEFRVVKINEEFKNVVVSHKALIEHELEAQKSEIMSRLEKGQVIEGVVKNITAYGAFLDLGGIDGLLHITDMSWGRINHPEEVLQIDQTINVVILDFDDEKKRIALGLKQLTPHPWDKLDQNLKVGDILKGRVTVIADYGAFMEIGPGLEGLIHVSEMSWSQHLRSPQEFIKPGEEVEAVILSLNREERKMSLGMKQLKPDPWLNVGERYPIGSKHKVTVRNFTNFGIFVECEEGVDGLVHISDLSWTKRIKHPAEFAKMGEVLDAVVLEVDEQNKRIAFGLKQLEENPWDVYETVFTVGSIHEGTVMKIIDKGAFIALPYGVDGYAPLKHMIKENKSPAKLNEKLEFKVIEFSKDSKRIVVSHSRVWEDKLAHGQAKENEKMSAEDMENAKTLEKIQGSVEKPTLGDFASLSSLKTELETSEREKKIEELNSKYEAAQAEEAEKKAKKGRPKKKTDEEIAAEGASPVENSEETPTSESHQTEDEKPKDE